MSSSITRTARTASNRDHASEAANEERVSQHGEASAGTAFKEKGTRETQRWTTATSSVADWATAVLTELTFLFPSTADTVLHVRSGYRPAVWFHPHFLLSPCWGLQVDQPSFLRAPACVWRMDYSTQHFWKQQNSGLFNPFFNHRV